MYTAQKFSLREFVCWTRRLAYGLSHTPKGFSAECFYEAPGSQLFQQIRGLPEYYPTRTELASRRSACALVFAAF